MKATKFAMAAALALSAFAANAALVTVNFNSSNQPSSNVGDGNYGNVRTFTTQSGVTVTASAWSLTGDGYTFQSSYLGRYRDDDGGLGVCNRNEGKNCDSPHHQVDNSGSYDFVLFQFSGAVDPKTVKINPYGNYDRDVSYWTGNIADASSLNGKQLTGLEGLGLLNVKDDRDSPSNKPRDVSIDNNGLVNGLLFGASVFDSNDHHDRSDWFKITSISFDYTKPTQVPEPGSLALIALALGGLGLARRRRAA
jgi:hypothetical protein